MLKCNIYGIGREAFAIGLGLVRMLCATLCLVALSVQQAWGLAYIVPEFDPNNAANNFWNLYPFGRVLWNLPVVADPTNPANQTMTLTYAFAPEAPAVNFKWETTPGTTITKKNRDFSNAQKDDIRAATNTWMAGVGTNGNLRGRDLGNKFDLQSTALHELGHAIGIGHGGTTTAYNAATSTATHTPTNENVNVKDASGNGNPRTFPVPLADKTNLIKTNTLQAVDSPRSVPTGIGATEAVMVQGVFANEVQRQLAFDDQQALSGIQSGSDFIQGTGDEFRIVFKEVDFLAPHVINIFNLDLGGAEGLTRLIPNDLQNPLSLQFSRIFLDQAFAPDGSMSQIALTDLLFTQDFTLSGSAQIGFANIYLDADIMFTPEPASIALLGIALAGLGFSRRKRAN